MARMYRKYRRGGPTRRNKRIWPIILIAAVLVVAIAATVILLVGAANGERVSHISVATRPDKTQYFTGEEADYTGLTILVVLKNGESYLVDYPECEITGFDSSKPASNQLLRVTYKDASCGFVIDINERPVYRPLLKSISLKVLPKTQYKVGEFASVDGGIILCTYQDGSTQEIPLTLYHIFNFTTETPGKHTVNVNYSENGVYVGTTYIITVTE